ncbi:MAG: hypothetical protein KBS89_05020 [Bacteroidales bacterium]|nr:hypothetical protein [Candidatus Egerieousia equi]
MDKSQTDKMITIPESHYNEIVRGYFSLQEENKSLHEEIMRYTYPKESSDLDYMKGIRLYLMDTLLDFTSVRDIEILYDDICVYADEFSTGIDPKSYNPVWIPKILKGYDICRMFWGINKAIGATGHDAGVFLKCVFPTLFKNSNPTSLGSNLTKYESNMVLTNVMFGREHPREYFRRLYHEKQNR